MEVTGPAVHVLHDGGFGHRRVRIAEDLRDHGKLADVGDLREFAQVGPVTQVLAWFVLRNVAGVHAA